MRKKLLLTTSLILLSSLSLAFAGGRGTQTDPYQISTCQQLQDISPNYGSEGGLDDHYKLVSNINCGNTYEWNSGSGFDPIGKNYDNQFKGHLNGNSHTISNLYINRGGKNSVGLIGVNGGTIERIVVDARITGDNRVGALAGRNEGEVRNSVAYGYIESYARGGGLIGYNGGIVNSSYSKASVDSSFDFAGGLTAINNGEVIESYSIGNVEGSNIGGLIGDNNGEVIESYWDKQSSGVPNGFGEGTGDATGLSTDDMQSSSVETTMSKFDFTDTWTATFDYPALMWEAERSSAPTLSSIYPNEDSGVALDPNITATYNDADGDDGQIEMTTHDRTTSYTGELYSGETITFDYWSLNTPLSECTTYSYDITVEDTYGKSTTYNPSFTTEGCNSPPSASISSNSPVLTSKDFGLKASGSSDPDGDSLTYEWDTDNDGNYDDASSVSPSVSKPDDGSYTIGLKVSDGNGGTDTASTTVTVENRDPSVSLSKDASNPLTSESVGFTASGSDQDGIISVYNWNIGGSGSSVSNSWSDDRSYTVSVTVIDDDGETASDSVTVNVQNRPPSADFSQDGPKATGEGISFDGSSSSDADGSISSYEWDWDDDGLYESAGQSASHSYSSSGSYTVTLKATDDDGATDTVQKLVTIENQRPSISFNSPSNESVGIAISADLNVSLSDPEGDDLNITFYDASDDSVIAEEFGVSAGESSSVEWGGLSKGESYEWYVNVTDGENKISSNVSRFKTVVDPDPPSVSSPSEGEALELDKGFEASVSHPDNEEMFVEMTLTDSNGDFVDDYTTNIDGGTVTWENSDLSYDQGYNLTVQASVSDSKGNIYSSSTSRSFETVLAPDQLATASVENVDPSNGVLKFDLAPNVNGLEVQNSAGTPVGLESDPDQSASVDLTSSLKDDKVYEWSVLANTDSGQRTVNFNFTTVTVEIELDENVEKASSYRVYRAGTKDGDYSQVSQKKLDGNMLVDSSNGLEEGETYCYKVTAVTEEGLESDKSSSECLQSQVEVTAP